MAIYRIDPIQDTRWQLFLRKHPNASIFHTPGWLTALRRTYEYEPFALTTSTPGMELTDGLLFCRIRSHWTGDRAVSLPFSDHCDPLVSDPHKLEEFLNFLECELGKGRLKYIEIRPSASKLSLPSGFGTARQYWLHRIDLSGPAAGLFGTFHKDCVQRKIRRAEREALRCEDGASETQVQHFYRLFVQTRRKHHLPPYPPAWLRNLIDCLGPSVGIHIAFKADEPVAGILTLRYKDVLIYKYGCADARYQALGGIQFLLWRAIRQAKESGTRVIDLGRSDLEDYGLITFKDRWGSNRSLIDYWRYPAARVTTAAPSAASKYAKAFARYTIPHLPQPALVLMSRLLYRHTG